MKLISWSGQVTLGGDLGSANQMAQWLKRAALRRCCMWTTYLSQIVKIYIFIHGK